MANWNYNPDEYTKYNSILIPEGNHRVRIAAVEETFFESSCSEGYIITLDVYGHDSKLNYYFPLNTFHIKKTNQRLGMFFESFNIYDHDLTHYKKWVGKVGAVRVKHGTFKDAPVANVYYCLAQEQQRHLPYWEPIYDSPEDDEIIHYEVE